MNQITFFAILALLLGSLPGQVLELSEERGEAWRISGVLRNASESTVEFQLNYPIDGEASNLSIVSFQILKDGKWEDWETPNDLIPSGRRLELEPNESAMVELSVEHVRGRFDRTFIVRARLNCDFDSPVYTEPMEISKEGVIRKSNLDAESDENANPQSESESSGQRE